MMELDYEIKSSVLFHEWYRIKLMCILKIHLRSGLSTENDIKRKYRNSITIKSMF